MMRKCYLSAVGLMLITMLVSACGSAPAATQPTAGVVATSAPAAPTAEAVQPTAGEAATSAPTAEAVQPTAASVPSGEQTVVTWYYFDQNNTDAKADERVGNAYVRKTLAQFNDEFKGTLTWQNEPQGYDLSTKLVTAVQTGGDVPDIMGNFTDSDLRTYVTNNTIQDVEWAKSQPWFSDLDPEAVAACTVDGKLMCVPIAQSPWVVLYYTDSFKNGFPTTPDGLLQESAALKKDGKYALTYWANTAFDGEGASRYFYMALASFGGGYDDGNGKMLLNRPENIQAIEFMRTIATNGYSPESVFAGNFEEEESFKSGKAGAFPVAYAVARNYLHPLTTPAGKAFDTNSPKDIDDAITSGALKVAPFVAPEGKKPGCSLQLYGLVIPRTAKNVEGAKTYINWIMNKPNTVDWITQTNGGFPAGKALQSDSAFTGEMAKQTFDAVSKSSCRPWYGSLTRIPEAKTAITNVIYDLIKTNPKADIAAALTKAQDEYNSGQ